ncbi:hypothetical protein Tco_0708675 [Tanacetum coccineum]
MLTAPKEKEELIVYLAAAKEAISAVLMTDREGKQVPVYFVSRTLRVPVRTAIKGQILADFIVERLEEESPDELMTEPEELPEPWTLFTDGSSCVDSSRAGLILTNTEGAEFTYAMRQIHYLKQSNKRSQEASGNISISQVPRKRKQECRCLARLHQQALTSQETGTCEELWRVHKQKGISFAVVEERQHYGIDTYLRVPYKEILSADKKKAGRYIAGRKVTP